MHKLKVGYLSLVKGSWLNDKLEQQRQNALEMLKQLDVELVDCGLLVQDEKEASKVYDKFNAEGVDVVLAHSVTFSLGSIIPSMAVKLGVPVILWSEAEPSMVGGRLEANSFCATNMNAHTLWKMNLKYSMIYGSAEDVKQDLISQLKAISSIKELKNSRIGSAGGRVAGFFTSNFNELAMHKKFGTAVEVVTLLELVKLAESIEGEELRDAVLQIKGDCKCSVSDDELNKAGALFAAFNQLSDKYNLDAWAVRCWPEFGELYGIGVCHVLGSLIESGVPAACEGDIYGALAMIVVKALSGSTVFFSDLISIDSDGDTGVFWHCGAAPVSLCRSDVCPELSKHSIIEGGGVKGVSCEFPVKPGPVTIVRIAESRDGSDYRMHMISGEGLKTEQMIKGNPLNVRFNRPARDLAEELVENGFEHHYSICHGDITKEVRLFAKFLDIELIEL